MYSNLPGSLVWSMIRTRPLTHLIVSTAIVRSPVFYQRLIQRHLLNIQMARKNRFGEFKQWVIGPRDTDIDSTNKANILPNDKRRWTFKDINDTARGFNQRERVVKDALGINSCYF